MTSSRPQSRRLSAANMNRSMSTILNAAAESGREDSVMQASYPELTPEQRQAIAVSGGLPVHLQDPDTHKVYVLVEQPGSTPIDDEYIRRELAKGIAALEAGER